MTMNSSSTTTSNSGSSGSRSNSTQQYGLGPVGETHIFTKHV